MKISRICIVILFSIGMFVSDSWAGEGTALDRWDVSLGGDNRARFQYTNDYELSNSSDKTKAVFHNRFRLNLKLLYEDIVDIFIEGLDAREGVYRTVKYGQSDDFDLHQANIELRNM